MQDKRAAQLEAMRRAVTEQSERWERAKEQFAAGLPPAIPAELAAEIDRACDVTVRPVGARPPIHNGAVRA